MVLSLSLYDGKKSKGLDTAFFFYSRSKSMRDVPHDVGVLRVDDVSDQGVSVALMFPGRGVAPQLWELNQDYEITYEGGVMSITPLSVNSSRGKVGMALSLPDHVGVERERIFKVSYLHRVPLEQNLYSSSERP